jgi:putative tryptophan/tyrosine transport system substrate-binding protein
MQRRDFITFLAGGLSGWSSVAGAQAAIRVIGYLSSGTAARPVDAGFHQGLSEIGYVEGQNLAIEYRWARVNTIDWPDWSPTWSAARSR